MATFEDFKKLEIKIGKIIKVEDHPNAEKLYLLLVDLGEKQIQLVAGVKPFYASSELEGKLVAVVVNLEPKNIRGVESQGMILAAESKDDVSLLVSDKSLPPGSSIK
jgi:methionyl-tRNA synthetase